MEAAQGTVFSSLGINFFTLIGQIVNFTILLFILKKMVYGPILRKLEERSKLVKKGIQAAEDNLKRQEKLEEEINQKLAETQMKVDDLLAKAKKDGEATYVDLVEKGKIDAEKLIEKERKQNQEQFEQQKKELQQEVVNIATSMTEKVLSDVLDEKTQQQILKTQLGKLTAVKLSK